MTILNGLTSQPRQTAAFVPEGGNKVSLYLEFSEGQGGWYFNLNYNGRAIMGRRLCAGRNILRQWKNVLPFGIAVVTTDGFDPASVQSLSDGSTALYVLTENEVAQIEAGAFTRG